MSKPLLPDHLPIVRPAGKIRFFREKSKTYHLNNLGQDGNLGAYFHVYIV